MVVEKATEDIREVGIGMLGYAFMGKSHSNGFKQMPYIFWPPPAIPRLVRIAGRDAHAVRQAARRYGFEEYTTDWHDVIEDERVEIFDNNGPNMVHMEPCIEAAKAKKDIICEKPLARNAEEAKEMLDAVVTAGVRHCCALNCSPSSPALVSRSPAMLRPGEIISAFSIHQVRESEEFSQ